MDPLPLIPETLSNNDAACSLRHSLQDTLNGLIYPKDIAKNIFQHKVDEELPLKQNAANVLETYSKHEKTLVKIKNAGNAIMEQQGYYMIEKDKIDASYELRESLKLKHFGLFKLLRQEIVEEFGLMQGYDLLPDPIQRYLDFRYNKDHLCDNCAKSIRQNVIKEKRKKKVEKFNEKCATIGKEKQRKSFEIIPNSVNFHNYVTGEIYKKNLKIINTSSNIQSVSIKQFPKTSCFRMELNSNSRLAPGMSAVATIFFEPSVYRNLEESVSFKNNLGDIVILPLSLSRDNPRLNACIVKPHMPNGAKPGKRKLLEERREALNSTIDCGSCLISQYQLVSVILENEGMPGKFFIITEEEWFSKNIKNISSNMELFKGGFWIYPTFFEMSTDEIMEINIIFQPIKPNLHVETFYLICDNNSQQELELIGDGLEFQNNLITIDVQPNDSNINKKENYCIFFGHTDNNTTRSLRLTVHNTSSLYLNCAWKFKNKPYNNEIFDIKENWLEVEKVEQELVPYSTTDFDFKITLNAEKSGYHSIFFSFFILNVPLICLQENENFYILQNKHLTEESLMETADVQVTEFEVACFADIPTKLIDIPLESGASEKCNKCSKRQKLSISPAFLNFGILPTGLNVQKEFFVQSLTEKRVSWKILEIKYNVDSTPYTEIWTDENISCTSGKFTFRWQKKRLLYNICNKNPISWVSMLVLVSIDEENVVEIESLCMVTFEIINYDIVIKTSDGGVPILCPLKLIYTGVPTEMSLAIENHSPIPGCFYFLKPYGDDSDKISIDFHPQSAIIKPFETIEVSAKLTCKEIGIFEQFFVPCFIGSGQEPIILRVLCAVDGVHVFFYVPVGNSYRKVIWPPKVVYEYDQDDGWYCPCKQQDCLELDQKGLENTNSFRNDENFSGTLTKSMVSEENFKPPTLSDNSSTAISTTASSRSEDKVYKLEEILRKEFGHEILLRDEVAQVVQVPVRTPTMITFFIENITPIKTTYLAETQNFYSNKDFDNMALNLKSKKKDQMWDDLIGTDYGILIQPDKESGILPEFGLIKVNIWIYANTWGIYSEEIIIDIPEVPSYSFSLLVEVTGCPVEFPMALNAITEVPVIRLGSIPYLSELIERKVKISNTSSLPIHIVWHSFIKTSADKEEQKLSLMLELLDEKILDKEKLVLMNRCYGKELTELCKILPEETIIKENSTIFLDLLVKPKYFERHLEDTEVKCTVLGHVYLEEPSRKKLNYFYRKSGLDFTEIKFEVTMTLTSPILTLDQSQEETRIIIYANEVIFSKIYDHYIRLVFQNPNTSPCDAKMSIKEPFFIKDSNNKLCRKKSIHVGALECLEITINCFVDHQKILELSNLLFGDTELNESVPYCADLENKCLHINRNFLIYTGAGVKMVSPINLSIYFPNITVNPPTVKFQSVLVNTTRKTMISVSNLTGYAVKFEIYKSSNSNDFYITPHYGEIGKSTGPNEQFVDIFIYFSPKECKDYQESIRIVTNIPSYFIEVPIKGTGTVNEKFYVNYKI